MLGKVIDNQVELAPTYIIESNVIISNPPKEKLIELGYRELTPEEIDELNSVEEVETMREQPTESERLDLLEDCIAEIMQTVYGG